MSFSQQLQNVMEEHGHTQQIPAAAAHVTSGTISKYTRGVRKPPTDVMRNIVKHYNEPELCIAAASEVNSDAFVPWLNLADLHKSNVHLKTLEEINEAVSALATAPITKRKDQLTATDLKGIRQSIMEQIEAITALMHNVAVLCKEYDFSWFALWTEHRQELKSKKYLN